MKSGHGANRFAGELRWRHLLPAVSVLLGSGVVSAQEPAAADLQLYYPVPDPTGFLNLHVGSPGGYRTRHMGFVLSGAQHVLRTEIADTGSPLGDVVAQRYDAALVVGVAFLRRLEAGLVLSATLHQDGLNTTLVRQVVGKNHLGKRGFNDIRGDAKLSLVDDAGSIPAMALALEVVAPTGRETAFMGEPSWVLAPLIASSKQLGRTLLALNLGYRYRSSPMRVVGVAIGDEIFYRAGIRYDPRRRGEPTLWNLLWSVYGHTAAADPWGLVTHDQPGFRNSLEMLFGLERRIAMSIGTVAVTAGVGVGLLPGYGSARLRGLLGIDMVNIEPSEDSDRDGLPDAFDHCPDKAEDKDGFADDDGCPDPDNDGDGIADDDDMCPNEPEDKDGVADQDGCPDFDYDNDGVPDDKDKCPLSAEDLDGFEDADGCPDFDNDRDGVPDTDDRCPLAPEDKDGFQDGDGCPDPDNDGDGLPDLGDMCPNEFEDQSTSTDHDGCPDRVQKPVLASLAQGQIRLSRPIEFDASGAQLAAAAHAILDEVAEILRKNPRMSLRVQVAPSASTPVMLRLANKRAQAVVRYLASRGIEASRLALVVVKRPAEEGGPIKLLIVE
jgi:hypothetical protein